MLDPNSPLNDRRDVDEASFRELLATLTEDAKRYARAEADVYRAKAMHRAALYRKVAIFGVAGFLIAQAALGALVVGLILSLDPLVGPFLATLAVVLVAFAIAGALFLVAWKRAKAAAQGKEPGQ